MMIKKIFQRESKLILLALTLFHIFLAMTLPVSSSYFISQTNPLDVSAKISDGKKEIPDLLNTGVSLLIAFLSINQIGTVSAADEVQYWCCPKMKDSGATCQNIPVGDESVCSEKPWYSSCATTTKCQTGTCIDRENGVCSVGTWYGCEGEWNPQAILTIDECKPGCCSTEEGTKKEYTRQITCTKKGGNFDSTITQSQCRLNDQELGACVLSSKACKFTTGDDCDVNLKGTFYRGSLCSNPDLGTNCTAPANENEIKTTCKNNKVYFSDSCGNTANVYDADKWNSADYSSYWSFVEEPECSVNLVDGVLDADALKNCGNCDATFDICGASSDATYGNYACKDVNCGRDDVFFKKFGRNPLNQESWCVYESYVGGSKDTVGSAHWVRYCDKGEIKTDLCDEYRMKICAEKEININELGTGTTTSFLGITNVSFARCRANEGWKCYSAEVDNYDFNSKAWLIDRSDTKEENEKVCTETSSDCRLQSMDLYFNPGGDDTNSFKFDVCVPKYVPGLKFWNPSSNAKGLCGSVNAAKCTTTWQRVGFEGTKSYWCVGNCACLSQKFADEMNDLCTSMGDCGGKVNVVGVYSKGFKVFDIGKLHAIGSSEPVLQSYIESNMNSADYQVEFTSKDLGGGFSRGDISESKKEEFKSYASIDKIGLGEIPKYLSTAEENAFGGSPIDALTFVGNSYTLSDLFNTLQYVNLGIAAGIVVVTAIVAAVTEALLVVVVATMEIPIVDIIVAAVVAIFYLITYFIGLYEEPVEVTVEFKCQPWQAPPGGKDCKKCNENPLIPCTEYKCKSLGARCNILKDVYESENPICVGKDSDDVNPPIIKFESISDDYKPEEFDNHVVIRDSDGGCVQEFSNINLTLKTITEKSEDDYSQCVYNWESGADAPSVANNFALNGELFKEGNFYSVNHTFAGRLPLVISKYASNVRGTMGQREADLTMYVRCMDSNGNANINEYTVDVCIKEGPDKTAATVLNYAPKDKSYLPYQINESALTLTMNEPVTCKWNYDTDAEYETMKNNFICEAYAFESQSSWDCTAFAKGLNKAENKLYIKCKDQPWISDGYGGPWKEADKNVNAQSFEYTFLSTEKSLNITSISPKGDVIRGGSVSNINLYVTTSGGADGGKAQCQYNFLSPDLGKDYFFQTGATQHTQPNLTLFAGQYTILATCEDSAKNKAEATTTFKMVVDNVAPKVTRVYKEGESLKIITDEMANCYYDTNTCSFSSDEKEGTDYQITRTLSTVHTIPWSSGATYYIKCKDTFENFNPDCAIKIIPSS